MLVKVRPIKGTTMHVWDRKKYYPGEVKEVDDDLAALLISRRIVEKYEPPKPEKVVPPNPVYKRGPGRPRNIITDV